MGSFNIAISSPCSAQRKSSLHPDKKIIGTKTSGPTQLENKCQVYAVKSEQGPRDYQEDNYAVVTDLLGTIGAEQLRTNTQTDGSRAPGVHMCAVFDGHGGNFVSEHCAKNFSDILATNILHFSQCDESLNPSLARANFTARALMQSFRDCENQLPEDASKECGSTAVVALIGPTHLSIAHSGDSRAVLARKNGSTVALTQDHKPERVDELARIKAAGGLVLMNGGYRVMGVLSMTRAIGDTSLKMFGVTSIPDVVTLERSAQDDFLLLASDGLWSSMSSQDAVQLARKSIMRSMEQGTSKECALRVASSVLVEAALKLGSQDNITVVLMDLADGRDRSADHEHAQLFPLMPVLSSSAVEQMSAREEEEKRAPRAEAVCAPNNKVCVVDASAKEASGGASPRGLDAAAVERAVRRCQSDRQATSSSRDDALMVDGGGGGGSRRLLAHSSSSKESVSWCKKARKEYEERVFALPFSRELPGLAGMSEMGLDLSSTPLDPWTEQLLVAIAPE